jgi:hypothetical protein
MPGFDVCRRENGEVYCWNIAQPELPEMLRML